MTSRSTMPAADAAALLERLRGRLVVSCQAPPDDPLGTPEHLAAIAASVARAPVAGIRAQGPANLRAIREVLSLPLIGLWKDGADGVYITPTRRHAAAVVEAGADIVAIDATDRPRPDGLTFADSVAHVHRLGRLVLADVSTLAEGVAAEQAGADMVATTLSGYTPYSPQQSGPDLDLVAALAARVRVPVVAEGRLHTPDQARAALEAGAWTVVVGTAITAPVALARRFASALE